MATIHDVAKLAGVGVGTASRAMSGSGSVAESTRIAVHEAAKMLSYRPSSAARALSKRQQGVIGVLTPHFGGSFYGEALSIAEREIRRADKHMMVASSRDRDYESWDDFEGLKFLEDRDCDGILILQSELTERELVVLAERIPAIALFNRAIPSLAEHCFSADHRAAGQAVAEHLLGKGHRQFAAITGLLRAADGRLRQQGYAEKLEEAGCGLDPRLVVEGDFYFPGGVAGAEALLASNLPFTAVFCGNDETAIAANAVFTASGRNVEVFGYDNIDTLRYGGLKISSVSVAVQEIISNACAFLFNSCYGGERPIKHEFSSQLILR